MPSSTCDCGPCRVDRQRPSPDCPGRRRRHAASAPPPSASHSWPPRSGPQSTRTASASHSGGTSRPSLNWRGRSTSYRRHLLLIARLALNGERDVLVGERFQSRFGHEVLPGADHATRETAEQVGQCALLRIPVGEHDRYHRTDTSRNWTKTRLTALT